MKRYSRDIVLLFLLVVSILSFLYTLYRKDGFSDDTKPIKIVFVCHSQESTDKILREQPAEVDVMFVGMGSVEPGPRIIICRDLEDNIEHEPKLLTFTAWYAIIKNNLYKEYSYVCIFEYDATTTAEFIGDVVQRCKEGEFDVISFFTNTGAFLGDVQLDIMDYIRGTLGVEYEYSRPWNHSSNHCIRRAVLQEFVEWYCQQYPYIKERDSKQLSWYHERLFAMYTYTMGLKQTTIHGASHVSASSHTQTINKE
jgi:hypothetical protein